MECLLVERSITLSCALDWSAQSMYLSAPNSYFTFCQLHHLDPDPTVNTLSLYITFMSHHIEPHLAHSYLAGIVCELEPSYTSVRQNWYSPLVVCTLKGSMRHFSNPVQQKSPLTGDDLRHVLVAIPCVLVVLHPWLLQVSLHLKFKRYGDGDQTPLSIIQYCCRLYCSVVHLSMTPLLIFINSTLFALMYVHFIQHNQTCIFPSLPSQFHTALPCSSWLIMYASVLP